MKKLVVGFGSPHGDDQLGWELIDALQHYSGPTLDTYKSKGAGVDWFEAIGNNDCIIFVDAVRSSAEPGTIHCLDMQSLGASRKFSSSHSIALSDSFELAMQLYPGIEQGVFLGIEAKQQSPMEGMSKNLEDLIPQVIERISLI